MSYFCLSGLCLYFATHSASDAVLAREPLKVLVWVGVVLLELFNDILAHVGVVLLDLLGSRQRFSLDSIADATTHTLSWSSGGMLALSPRSRSSCCTKYVMSRPAMGMCLIDDPMTYPSACRTLALELLMSWTTYNWDCVWLYRQHSVNLADRLTHGSHRHRSR